MERDVVAYRASTIKSVQRGTISLSGVTSNTATITAVDPNNTMLVMNGFTSDETASNYPRVFPLLQLTNATTVTASKQDATSTTVVSFEVIEFYPGVLRSSVQRGTIAITNAVLTATATITAVTTAKTMLSYTGWEAPPHQGGGEVVHSVANIVLTNSTTLTATRLGGNGTLTLGYQVVEFK